MSGKPKFVGRLETEIEKNREESNWKKVAELADQLISRSPECESLGNFLKGESKLELYLEEFQPSESNISKAKNGLAESKRLLISSMDEQGAKLGLVTDAYLLLAKLHYAMGLYEEALKNLAVAGLNELNEKPLPNRILRVVTESFAVKGFCLEKTPPSSTSKFKLKEREEQIIKSFEKSGNLCLLYLQELDKSRLGHGGSIIHTAALSATTGSSSPLPTSFFRTTNWFNLRKCTTESSYYPYTNIQRAIDQYRSMLSTVESTSTQGLRLTLSRQLAEVLLRGVSGESYIPPENIHENKGKAEITSSPWKPRKYGGINLFSPTKDIEEILLLLMISEAMAVRNAVLDRSPDIKEARTHSHNNATAVYDLMCITLCRLRQITMLSESFERAMKFAFEDFHVWFQFALSLIGCGKFERAELVLKECSKLAPTNSHPCLLAAKLCYENLGMIDKGLQYAQEALEREKMQPQGLLARCLLTEGVGYSLKSSQTYIQKERQELVQKAFECFHRAQSLDPNDHLVEFYLAFHYAQARQIPEAIQRVKTALNIYTEHIPSLHLLALLLSAQKQHEQALHLIEVALDEYPDDLNLMYTKAHLEASFNGTEEALLISKEMLHIWKSLYENHLQNENEQALHRVSSETRSVLQFHSSDKSEYDTNSLHAGSVAASRIEHTFSEAASTLSSFHPKPGPQNEWVLQVHIWLLIAELYLEINEISEAESCVHEASNIVPLSHHVMFMKGLVHEQRDEFHEAKICYQNAISVNPLHIKTLQHLGMVYHYLGHDNLAEKTLQDAVKTDPMAHETWYNLGKVLSNMKKYESASDCLATAIDLESTSPILPFTVVQRTLE
ncbi:Tetratricopeptide repeat protein 7B [Nymphon striatum]|nr:Tetratricopeptide repeat protein 7B [Nymphon striatum]